MKELFKTLLIFTIAFIGMSATSASDPTIYFIGDSTMADYDPAVYPNQRGWGQMFRNFLTGNINFVNAARNGRSSRTFYKGADSLWANVRTALNPGDYVFIQFAHNDEKYGGLSDPATTGQGTAPWGDYQDYLRSYVKETRAKGAIPVLVTAIVRNYFAGDTITYKGRHNLATDDSTLNYVRAMKAVARELSVPLIDHTALTRAYAESLGAANATSTIYAPGDNTHLNPTGATIYAQLAVQEILKQKILTGYLNASPSLIITPSEIDFGTSYISAYSSSKISVSGLSLSPSSGNITVNAPDGFAVGLSASGTFASSVQLPYSGGNLSTTDVFVHFQPTAEKTYSDSISISYGSTTKKVSVKGIGLSMINGVKASVNYPLISNATPTVSGPITSVDESWTGMTLKNYASITTWPTGVTVTNVQRNDITGGTWPAGEIDINTSRYIQFGVKPNAGTSLTIDSIGLYAGVAGGNGMKYRVLYSKSENFSNPVTLEDKTSNTSNTMVALSYKPMVQVAKNEVFYLRFYPWYSATATSKYFCLSNLTISSRVTNKTTGIEQAKEGNRLTVYPNPSKGVFYLNNVDLSSACIAEVYNQIGALICRSVLTNNLQTIDLSEMPNGIYILRIINGQQVEKQLLIKE
ncbi:GDSL-type esterase/lipase family protein [Parabacteroides sp. FAFU027]|uniref:GDSL-type esterase/lipase family protein n=1 Tax=Parabacteroides sp. FAFU027 TaxID=2922715 RepID=UPI001FAFBF00|nr:GDSL-type esterase/lipase family protein [Parabacteroides sp. FAFU027]